MRGPAGRGAAMAAMAAVGLLAVAGCGRPPASRAVRAVAPAPPPATLPLSPPVPPPLPPLVDAGLSLLAPPVAVPLRFRVASLGIDAPVLAVGRTPAGSMDAPEGPASSPLWQEAFWYRGGSDPGRPGTSTIAGHVDDVLGRPAAFWNIRRLQPGDVVEIADERDGGVLRYRITEAAVYSVTAANSPAVLQRLYGSAAYDGDPTERDVAADAVSRISIITCTGTFHRGSSFGYDHRFIAFGVLIPGGDAQRAAATVLASRAPTHPS
jgi:Sortase domain